MPDKKIWPIFLFIGLIIFVVIAIELILSRIDKSEFFQSIQQDTEGNLLIEHHSGLRLYDVNLGERRSNPRNIWGSSKSFIVLILGESTAQGFPYESQQSWTGVLKEFLRRAITDQRVEVINLGYSGINSYAWSDIARRVLPTIKPDLIVLYAGHNEYYGLPDYGPFTRLVIWLRQFALYRALESLVASKEGSGNLMEERFNQYLIDPHQADRHKQAAQRFLANLDNLIQVKGDVPLLVVEPISNLAGIPPFRSTASTEEEQKLGDLAKSSSWEEVEQRLQQWQSLSGQDPSLPALGIYQKALRDPQLEPARRLQLLTEARDRDWVPFRARGELIRQLRDQINTPQYQSRGVQYLPLEEVWFARFGLAGFSNLFFVDHVHFGAKGQVALAASVIEALPNVLPLVRMPNLPAAVAWLRSPEEVLKSLRWTKETEVMALGYITNLLSNEPFRSMIMPYRVNVAAFGLDDDGPPRDKAEAFFQGLESGQNYPMDWVAEATAQNRTSEANRLLQWLQYIYPASANVYYNRALLYEALDYPSALRFYALAYLLDPSFPDLVRRAENFAMVVGKDRQVFYNAVERVKNEVAPWEVIDVGPNW